MDYYGSLDQAARKHLKMYKLDPSVLNSILTQDVKLLRDVFSKHKYEIRIVGGAVRDLLMGERPKDLNFVTTATTKEMKDIFAKEQNPTVNSSEEKYGIIQVSINSSHDLEINQIKVATAGRPTETDWRLDAEKRDFTINAMYLDFDGNIYDHFSGREDLKERKVRYIADADSSMKEDSLRILRYFRFHGKIAENPANHEGLILLTIMKNVDMLRDVPGQLIWNELKMILRGKSREIVIKSMMAVNIGRHIGLWEGNLAEFQNVSRKNVDMDTQPIILLAAFMCNKRKNALRIWMRYQLSKDELDIMEYIIKNRRNMSLQVNELLPYLKRIYCGRLLSTEHLTELLLYQGRKELIDKLEEIPKFPIDKSMLEMPINGLANLKDKFVVEELVNCFYESGYNLSAEEILKLLPNIAQKFERRLKKRLSRSRNRQLLGFPAMNRMNSPLCQLAQ